MFYVQPVNLYTRTLVSYTMSFATQREAINFMRKCNRNGFGTLVTKEK